MSHPFRIDSDSLHVNSAVEETAWDAIFDAMGEHGVTRLDAGERMTDAALLRLGERADVGVTHLDIGGWRGQLTDAGLAALSRLPHLKNIQLCWQQNITDAGAAQLGECADLEEVNLIGTHSGDGALRALKGRARLRKLNTGRNVTDAGIPMLRDMPAFKTWLGGDLRYGLMSPDAEPTHVQLDGPFTDGGLAQLAGLDGLFGLSFFWHCSGFTPDGLKGLRHLPNLGFLGCQGENCDDAAMAHIAAIPKLRMLMAQGTVATDAGFAKLGASQTIEFIWGRECPNLGPAGFEALSTMPALKGLAVSCKNVDLSILPRFPALTQFMPMDATDDDFRHIALCTGIEALWCMYCRETGDIATGHIAALPGLKSYYAGKTRITDRSLEMLARMPTLERVELWQCEGVTPAGLALLGRLPHLSVS